MSNPAVTIPVSLPAEAAAPAKKALGIGLVGIALTLVGLPISGASTVATAWLVAVGYWTAVAIGMLMLILLHHAFDSFWAAAIRRQMEHWTGTFKWLLLLFLPLIAASAFYRGDIVWPWMSGQHFMHAEGKTVAADVIYAKKAGFLNLKAFTIFTVFFYCIWMWLSARVRKASISQDADGDPKWTTKNRFTCGMGIPIVGLSLTAAAIYWFKSLEYHWFSTMYGVWYFADCIRLAYSILVFIMFWLYRRGDYKGVVHEDTWHSIGQMMLAFTVFWAYVCFAQYFLIWNADVPEETFWYNIREWGDWWWLGMFLVFGNFLLPFCLLLSYRFKVTQRIIRRIAAWILFSTFIDICWNILPVLKDAAGHPRPFFSLTLLWTLTSMAGVGGICFWAYLRRIGTTKLIPIRDPRIGEALRHHD